MSILIKGFPLPNNCGACPLRLAWCRERIYMVTRPKRCPLISVPPHGRLIDADALRAEFKEPNEENGGWINPYEALVHKTGVWAAIEDAPTIIEAEEGE